MKRNIAAAALAATAFAVAASGAVQASASAAPVTGMPQMGYSTWYQYRDAANEADMLAEGKLLVSSGMAAAGYNVVSLDDGWMLRKRDASGNLVADPVKFPDGMLYLAQQLHAMGLRFGIYEAIGTRTCLSYPGSYGHYSQDAALFTSWQVDDVKIDSCGGTNASDEPSLAADYATFTAGLRAGNPGVQYTEQLPILFLNTKFFGPAVLSASQNASSWRISPDEYGTPLAVITRNLTADVHLHGYARSGHWNDLDLLVPPSIMPSPSSASYLPLEEAQLGGWAMEASPLQVSGNLAALTKQEMSALMNRDVIAVDQSGHQSAKEMQQGAVMTFVKAADGGTAVYLLNTGTVKVHVSWTLKQLGVSKTKVTVQNVWTGTSGAAAGITTVLAPGSSSLLVLR